MFDRGRCIGRSSNTPYSKNSEIEKVSLVRHRMKEAGGEHIMHITQNIKAIIESRKFIFHWKVEAKYKRIYPGSLRAAFYNMYREGKACVSYQLSKPALCGIC